MVRALARVAVLVCVCAVPLMAQDSTAVSGVVRDTSGAVLPGTLVDVVVAGRAVATATTDGDGRYRVQAPRRAPFDLQLRLAGFAEQAIAFRGTEGDVTRDIVLQVGQVSDTLVVTASRGAESRANVTQAVTVVTAADLHALGAPALADAIRFVPGVAVEGTGREGALTSMFSRGGESDYNLVLIDGVRVNQNGGFFDFSRIGAAEIDRVEIVRGAQSSLWGSDAMGSVVQIFTKRAGAGDAPRVSGSLEGGSFKTTRSDARITGGFQGRLDYQAGAFTRRTDGAFADILPQDDEFEQDGFDLGVGTTLGSRLSLRSAVRSNQGRGRAVGPITYGSRDTGTKYRTRDLAWHADVSHTLGTRYTGSGTVSYFKYDSYSEDLVNDAPVPVYMLLEGTPNALYPNGMTLVRQLSQQEFDSLRGAGAMPAPNQYLASTASFDFAPSRNLGEVRRPGIRYQGDVAWANGQRLSVGYDWERERRPAQTTPGILPELVTVNNAFFVQQQIGIADRWFVTGGVRVDDKESYDTFVSPKLSAGGYVLPLQRGAVSSVKVFGNIGKGIKTPTFLERFGAGFADPNPDLKVEEARTADLGVEATFADQRLRANATYFDNSYKNQIAFRSGVTGDGLPEYINIDGSKATGLELELALQRSIAGVTAGVTYALVDTEVVTNISTSQQFQPGQPLLRRPKHSGTFRVGYAIDRVTVSVDTRWLGDRHDNSFLFLSTVETTTRASFGTDITVNPGYAVAGLGVDVRLAREATVFVRANNIGDTVYDSALGYPGLPRSAMAGVRFDVGRR